MTAYELEGWSPPGPKKIDHDFRDLVQGREVEFPTLARAARKIVPAVNIAIEWEVGSGIQRNYQQIFRHQYKVIHREGSAYSGGDASPEEALVPFLQAVEKTLEHGTPFYTRQNPWKTCGGYRHYLGRDLIPSDRLILRPLRQPFLWIHEWRWSQDHGWIALDHPMYEWLAEISLEVLPGD